MPATITTRSRAPPPRYSICTSVFIPFSTIVNELLIVYVYFILCIKNSYTKGFLAQEPFFSCKLKREPQRQTLMSIVLKFVYKKTHI